MQSFATSLPSEKEKKRKAQRIRFLKVALSQNAPERVVVNEDPDRVARVVCEFRGLTQFPLCGFGGEASRAFASRPRPIPKSTAVFVTIFHCIASNADTARVYCTHGVAHAYMSSDLLPHDDIFSAILCHAGAASIGRAHFGCYLIAEGGTRGTVIVYVHHRGTLDTSVRCQEVINGECLLGQREDTWP